MGAGGNGSGHVWRGKIAGPVLRRYDRGSYLDGMRKWLSPGGFASALVVGLAVLAGLGWRGLVLLFAFLVSSSLLTPGGGSRRPVQVFANGGVAALCSLLALLEPTLAIAAAAAIAAATADTWSTEIGARSKARPRLITTWEQVEPGVSGGITALGTLGGALGAAFIGLAAWLVGLVSPAGLAAVAAAGAAGMLVDSMLGATLQARWRCESCAAVIEQPVHSCGAHAVPLSGIRWMTNDAVNFAATLAGAMAAGLPAILEWAGLA